MMKDLTIPMFEAEQSIIVTQSDEMALSCVATDKQALRNIMHLHNGGRRFAVDAAYSKGVMWRGLPEPEMKFDLAPQVDGVEQSDARSLPLEDGSVDSVAFDPPFLVRTGSGSLIKDRFSCFSSVDEMWSVYGDALSEFMRVLEPKGIVAFKCQSQIYSGKQVWSEEEVFFMARQRGFYVQDKLYRLNGNPMARPGNHTQRHARRNVSTWWVFRK